MKLLIANPNSSEIVTDIIFKSAQKKKRSSTELIPLTNPLGTKGIDCAFADYMSTYSHIKATLAKVNEINPDAVVLAGFGNMGLHALKEALKIPVVCISESTIAVACLFGHRFSTVTVLKQLIPYHEDLVKLFGFESRCASCRSINIDIEKAAVEREKTLKELKIEMQRIIKEDGADVIILAGAGLCGYEDELSDILNLPVLDPVVVSIKVAEMMVETGLCQSKRYKFSPPPQTLRSYYCK